MKYHLKVTAILAPAALMGGYATSASSLPGATDLRLTYQMAEAEGKQIPYRVYLPQGWSSAKKWPLVVVLHGFGATADQPFDEAAGLLQREADKRGFVVLSPNGYNGMADYGANLPLPSVLPRTGTSLAMTPQDESRLAQADVLNVLERAVKDYRVDTRRIYLMGNSMGMTGVLHFARMMPERWCAISASGGPPWPDYPVERLRPLAGALFVHGGRDNLAKVADTQRLTERAKAIGVDAHMQVMPEGTHGNAWVQYLPETFAFFDERLCSDRSR